jgi:hypothetical protein
LFEVYYSNFTPQTKHGLGCVLAVPSCGLRDQAVKRPCGGGIMSLPAAAVAHDFAATDSPD